MLDTLAQYRILDRIGAGGSAVYRARDTRLGRTVAIKVLADAIVGDPERRDRFLRDARATAALSHPNIAALYEIGEDKGHVFLACEFVPGQTLKAVIGGHPMNPRRALDIGVQLADALAEAHAAGIVHRDITPTNIIITPKGHAKILDFGLTTWAAVGAERDDAPYLSPEQAHGDTVDHRTDLFSLGVVLFEMLSGTLPFRGTTAADVAVPPAAPASSSANKSLPSELDVCVAKAIAKNPDARYQSAATLAADLRAATAILDVRTAAHAPSTAAVIELPRRRSYTALIALVLAIAVLAAAVWLLAGVRSSGE